ncbi:MAG: hypothetical protein HYR89_03375 [Actinobacteria bacterium]|nr:hypothetical protein [Actinomycetota bacterium]
MSISRKGLLTAGVVLLVGTLTGLGTFSAFTGTTSNDNNYLNAGTVSLSDNDSGSPMYAVSPYSGATQSYCINVTFTGNLTSTGQLYLGADVTPLGQYTNLLVEQGTGVSDVFPGCSGLTGSTPIFNSTLQDFRDLHTSNTNGLATNPLDDSKWNAGDVVSYRFTVDVQDNSAQGLTTGLHPWTWEATGD